MENVTPFSSISFINPLIIYATQTTLIVHQDVALSKSIIDSLRSLGSEYFQFPQGCEYTSTSNSTDFHWLTSTMLPLSGKPKTV
jgi:hypothetical protein